MGTHSTPGACQASILQAVYQVLWVAEEGSGPSSQNVSSCAHVVTTLSESHPSACSTPYCTYTGVPTSLLYVCAPLLTSPNSPVNTKALTHVHSAISRKAGCLLEVSQSTSQTSLQQTARANSRQQHHGGTGSKALATTAAAARQHTMPGAPQHQHEACAHPISLSAGVPDWSNPQQFRQWQQQLGQQPQQAVVTCWTQQQQ